MTDVNLKFCRILLKGVVADVRKHYPATKVSDAAVLKMSGGGTNQWWLFEYMDPAVGRFAVELQADNAYHARAEGWSKWLEAKGVADYQHP